MSEEENQGQISQPAQSNNNITIQLNPQQLLFVSLAIIGLVLICLFGFLLVDPFNWLSENDDQNDEEIQATVVAAEATAAASSQTEDVIVVFDGTGTLSIDLDPPQLLTIRNRDYPIETQFVSQEGSWVGDDSGEIEWVFGSIINQVYGFPSNEANQILLEQLVPGDRVSVQYQSGETKSFLITGREIVERSNADLFAQSRPGINLVWLGQPEAGGRLIVTGDFALPDNGTDNELGSAIAEVGETVQLADLRISVSDTAVLAGDPNTPPGFSLFLVNFQIENIGPRTLDTGLLRLVLADEDGNQYSLNPTASQAGTNPILSGFLETGVSRGATAGYQIPANLSSPQLMWSVSRTDSPGRVEVMIPFVGERNDAAQVSVDQAEVSLDGTTLLLAGSIQNNGEFPLVVNESDLSLRSQWDGISYLFHHPRLPLDDRPWSIQPIFALLSTPSNRKRNLFYLRKRI